jgi:hypothetical protein
MPAKATIIREVCSFMGDPYRNVCPEYSSNGGGEPVSRFCIHEKIPISSRTVNGLSGILSKITKLGFGGEGMFRMSARIRLTAEWR